MLSAQTSQDGHLSLGTFTRYVRHLAREASESGVGSGFLKISTDNANAGSS